MLVLHLWTYFQWVSPVWEARPCARSHSSQFQSLQHIHSSPTHGLSASAASTGGRVCFTNPSLFFFLLPFSPPPVFSWLSGSNLTIRGRKKCYWRKILYCEKFKSHVLNQLLLMPLVKWAPVFYFSKTAGSAGLRFLISPSSLRGEQGQNSFQLSRSQQFLKS